MENMQPLTYLKLQNDTIAAFNFDEAICLIYDNARLPIYLRDTLTDTSGLSIQERYRTSQRNYNRLMGFFSKRTISIDRENAKYVLNALHISQGNDYDTIQKIMFLCKALSVTDDYWITNDENESWNGVNLRENHLTEVISQIALSGRALTITGNIHTPELTGQGAYAKGWFREPDGLYLYKAGYKNGPESNIECVVSNILDRTNVPHVQYFPAVKDGRSVCKCKNMCSNDYSIVPTEDVISWCQHNDVNFDTFVRKLDSETFYKTIVVDYLISNRDRHGQNWGFYMDNHTGELISLHPLYDHNNAFDVHDMNDSVGGESLMILGKSKKAAAMYAIKRCDFKVGQQIDRSLFLNSRQYESFTNRMQELGIKELSKFIPKEQQIPPLYESRNALELE